MDISTIEKTLIILRKKIKQWKVPVVGVIAENAVDRPFETLISTILSLRTKDAVTMAASLRLFEKAKTPQEILKLKPQEIEKLIYPAGFYKTKAKSILKTCAILMEKYDGKVPRSMEELLALPGVGRKTANLVLTVGFNDYGICVDTHVHRISNRWEFIKTKTPDESEMALRQKLPKKHWKTYNDILVTFGQNLCVPISPWCSKCPVRKHCQRMEVNKSR
ncbi:MAG: endonuclease III [Deltaproteobacteria bacterium GWA2_45_12]|nr:MAG: endonuclease III [Deltaproteobacteria bacterium GWA2_45_12]